MANSHRPMPGPHTHCSGRSRRSHSGPGRRRQQTSGVCTDVCGMCGARSAVPVDHRAAQRPRPAASRALRLCADLGRCEISGAESLGARGSLGRGRSPHLAPPIFTLVLCPVPAHNLT